MLNKANPGCKKSREGTGKYPSHTSLPSPVYQYSELWESRNQARISQWYRDKYRIDYPMLTEACQSLQYYPSQTSAIAVRRDDKDAPVFRAPFGLNPELDMTLRPNRTLPIRDVYEDKARH